MKSRRKVVVFTIGCVVMLVAAGLVGALSPLGNNTGTTLAATPQTPILGGGAPPCTAGVSVTNLQSESRSLGAVRRITVNWSYSPPACCGLGAAGFTVSIEVKRDSGSNNTEVLQTPGSERALSKDFANLGIKSVTAKVSARVASPGSNVATRTLVVEQ